MTFSQIDQFGVLNQQPPHCLSPSARRTVAGTLLRFLTGQSLIFKRNSSISIDAFLKLKLALRDLIHDLVGDQIDLI